MQDTRHSITARLLGGIVVVATLLAFFSVTAIIGTREYHQAVERLYYRDVLATVQLSAANDRLWRLRYGFPQYLVTDAATREQIVREEPMLDAEIRKILSEYSKLAISDEEREQLGRVEAAYARYMNARPQWFALVNAGRLNEAAEYRARTTTPWGVEAVDAFGVLVQTQQEGAKRESMEMIDHANHDRWVAIILMTVMVIIVIPMLVGLMRVMRTLREAQQLAIDAATNVFKEPIVVAGRDELDTLISAIHLTTERFVAYTSDIEVARAKLAQQHELMEREVCERTVELKAALSNMERQARQAKLLADLNDRLQSCQDQSEARSVVASFAPVLFPGVPGLLSLINASRNLVDVFSSWGELTPGIELQFEPEVCWGIRRNRVHYSMSDGFDVPCRHVGGAEALCVPMYNQDGAMGLLILDAGRREMSREELEQLAIRFTNQVALALSNLRLRQKLREQSIIDSLTTLFNRRYFEETLEREVSRAQRSGSGLALLVLDVDHFKRFNDNYGHDAGDRILNLVGRVIRSSIRPSDIGCRYGGEEFVIVMPEIVGEVVLERANELRCKIAKEVSEAYRGDYGTVTVSCGVAFYPAHGQDGGAVFVAADKALYAAKRLGRNRVELAADG